MLLIFFYFLCLWTYSVHDDLFLYLINQVVHKYFCRSEKGCTTILTSLGVQLLCLKCSLMVHLSMKMVRLQQRLRWVFIYSNCIFFKVLENWVSSIILVQMGKDVVSFLTWAAEPEMEERKLVIWLLNSLSIMMSKI